VVYAVIGLVVLLVAVGMTAAITLVRQRGEIAKLQGSLSESNARGDALSRQAALAASELKAHRHATDELRREVEELDKLCDRDPKRVAERLRERLTMPLLGLLLLVWSGGVGCKRPLGPAVSPIPSAESACVLGAAPEVPTVHVLVGGEGACPSDMVCLDQANAANLETRERRLVSWVRRACAACGGCSP
jgi:hypothetical protein